MSYEKTLWSNGDVITAEKLNNIENGISASNNVFYIEEIYDETSETYIYVSNVVFDAEEKYSNVFFKAENGVILNLDKAFNGVFYSESWHIYDDPSGIGISRFAHEIDDETGLKYTKEDFFAELTFIPQD